MSSWWDDETMNAFKFEVRKSGKTAEFEGSTLHFSDYFAEPTHMTIRKNASSGQVLIAFQVASLMGIPIVIPIMKNQSEVSIEGTSNELGTTVPDQTDIASLIPARQTGAQAEVSVPHADDSLAAVVEESTQALGSALIHTGRSRLA
jgi:hypothetical protein